MENLFTNEEIEKVAKEFVTPIYLYDENKLNKNIDEIKNISSNSNLQINYATKANNNLSILKIIKDRGLKADAVSVGEVFINKQAGYDVDKIYVVGNNFTRGELKQLTDQNLIISVDAIDQLVLLNEVAPNYKNLMLRVNPSIGAGENESIITGGYKHKFGIDEKDIPFAINFIKENGMKLVGINQHIGSLTFDYLSIVDAVQELLDLILKYELNDLEIINFGGGFGINYKRKFTDERIDFDALKIDLDKIFEEFLNTYNNKKVSLEFEPGRYIVANTSVLIGEVTSIKEREDKIYVGTNLGFSQLIRPTLYNSYHEVEFLTNNTKKAIVNVVGNMCESGDYMAREREMIIPNVGDLVVVHDAGAYGYCMANNYNSTLKPIEVMKTEDESFKIIRNRETFEELLKSYGI